MRRVELGAVAALAAALLAGCVQPAEPTPSASPTPTYLCTPEAGGDEAPCSEADYQKMKEKDALYAEAEQVYRKYKREMLKALQGGGATELSAGLKAVVAPGEVRDGILQNLRYFAKNNLRVVGAGSIVKSGVRRPGLIKRDSLVAMDFCVDGRETAVYQGKKRLKDQGSVAVDTVFFGDVSGHLKIVAASSKAVSSCDGQ